MGFDYYNWMNHHVGHHITCVRYGDKDHPEDVCIECETCNEVLFSAESLSLSDEDNQFIEFDFEAECE